MNGEETPVRRFTDREEEQILALERLGADPEIGAEALYGPALEGIYPVRCKALEMFRVLGKPEDCGFLLSLVLDREQPEEFRLRALDVLGAMGYREALPGLGRLLPDPNPFLTKGTVSVLGAIGGREAMEMLLHFSASPAGRVVKRAITAEALGRMLRDRPELAEVLESLKKEHLRIRWFLRDLDLTCPEILRFGAYPANDYVARMVREKGYDYRHFKYLVERNHA